MKTSAGRKGAGTLETIVTIAAVAASLAIIFGFLSSLFGMWETKAARAKKAQTVANDLFAKISEDVDRADKVSVDGQKLYLTVEAKENQPREKIIYSEDGKSLKRLVNNRLEDLVDPKLRVKITDVQFTFVSSPLGLDRNLRVQMIVEASTLFNSAQSVVDNQIPLRYTQI